MLILALFSPPTHAQSECPTILLDQDRGTASGIPVWNQANLPVCYSYTASFLASVWIREEWSKTNPTFRYFIDDPKHSYEQMEKSPEFNQILDADQGRTCQAMQYILNSKRIQTGDPQNPFFTSPQCDMWGFTQAQPNAPKTLQNPADFEAKMHQLLEGQSRPLPFAIEYCSSVEVGHDVEYITNRTFRSSLAYLNDDQAALENLDPYCSFHAAVVTGQKMRNGSCYFRVRNTAGEVSYGTEVENGYFWIPASSLAKNTLRVISLRDE